MVRCIIIGLLLLALSACASQPGLAERIQAGHVTLTNAGFEIARVDSAFLSKAWLRDSASETRQEQPWHVYIEGDGAAWQGQGRPSANPTPQTPVALYLAARDPSPRVIYLARPCQFFTELPKACHFTDWTTERYAPRQAARMGQVLEALISDETAILIGFSGGALLALQIAEQHPTRGIVTVAGNLDDRLFSQYHRLATPSTPATRPTELPIWSLSGGNDDIIPPVLTERMLPRVASRPECRQHHIDDRATHIGPWHLEWERILALLERCNSPG